MSGSIFEKKREEKKTLSVKIDSKVKDDIDSIQERLKFHDPDMTFPVANIIEEALKKAIKKANAELDEMPNVKDI